jgi:PleD family two-component response regulator
MSSPEAGDHTLRPRRGGVLVIDGDALARRALVQALGDQDVVAVGSGEVALAIFTAPCDFDVVFCSVVLLDIDVVQFVRLLRRSHPTQAERLIFTIDGDPSQRIRRLLDTAPNLCLTRPVDAEGLLALVARRVRVSSTHDSWGAQPRVS